METSKSHILIISLVLLLLPILSGCSSTIYKTVYPTLSDGKYDSEFPYKGSSEELEQISKTVNRVNSIAFYKAYIFNRGSNIKRSELNETTLENNSNSIGYFDKSSSGTATTIYSQNGEVGLLTCAHVVSFPDTILSYYTDRDGKFTEYLESVSIRENQLIFAAGFPGNGDMDIIARDRVNDIALLGKSFSALDNNNFPVFPYPKGKAKDLEWGTFVYVFGYPMNYKMVSKAIVSSPNYDNKGSFLIDAVVNRGFSGGVVLSIRDGIPNFEFVGIIRAVPEEIHYVLQPEKLQNNIQYSSVVPYNGNAYAVEKEDLKYGIAKVIPMELITEFLEKNASLLEQKGYILKNFF
ncbi:MAG: serine protease [Ignavibacteriaceae bacterium]